MNDVRVRPVREAGRVDDDDNGIVTASITITRMFYPARDNPEYTIPSAWT